MEKWKQLRRIVPEGPEWRIDWEAVENAGFSYWMKEMKAVQQNPLWHGEGDVWTHTRMVCEELVSLPAYRELDREKQEILFLAALLHDIGKIPCTRSEDGTWVSPNHSTVGSRMTREILWLQYGFCGMEALQRFRETVCTLIQYHSVPVHILDQEDPERRLIKIASNAEQLPDFSVELLCLLGMADMAGRICDDREDAMELVRLCGLQAADSGCLKTPAEFPDDFSEYACLSGRGIVPGQALYDDSWGEVVLMCGLPGTGKDTWIREHYSGCPVISLDALRKQMKVSPKDNQGRVVSAAREMAKEYLRKQTPFVWNATCLTPVIREKQIRLFTDYHASVRVVYLETEWEEQLRRNREREAEVPESVICSMLRDMSPPERFEAHRVEWHCV